MRARSNMVERTTCEFGIVRADAARDATVPVDPNFHPTTIGTSTAPVTGPTMAARRGHGPAPPTSDLRNGAPHPLLPRARPPARGRCHPDPRGARRVSKGPRSTTGGVNVVLAFGRSAWTAAGGEVPDDLADFAPIVGPDGFTIPADQHDIWVWISGNGYDGGVRHRPGHRPRVRPDRFAGQPAVRLHLPGQPRPLRVRGRHREPAARRGPVPVQRARRPAGRRRQRRAVPAVGPRPPGDPRPPGSRTGSDHRAHEGDERGARRRHRSPPTPTSPAS